MFKHDTWYVLEDGTTVDPNEVAPDKDGVLRHKDGVAVAMRSGVPHTRGVDIEKAYGHKSKKPSDGDAADKTAPPKKGRQMKAGDDEGGNYETR